MHPRRRRCSSFKYSRYSQSSRLAGGAPRSSRCNARLSPRAVESCSGRLREQRLWCERHVINHLAVLAEIEAELLLLLGDAQRDEEVGRSASLSGERLS